jgi:hypothetical protein
LVFSGVMAFAPPGKLAMVGLLGGVLPERDRASAAAEGRVVVVVSSAGAALFRE